MDEPDGRRVELIAGPEPERHEAALTGGGLLLGLFLGRSSLLGAASGAERIDAALAHFVLTVLVCVGSLLFLGRLYGSFQTQARAREVAAAKASAQVDTGPAPGDEGSPPAMMPPSASATS